MLSDEFIERALNDWRRHRISLHEAVRAVAESAVKDAVGGDEPTRDWPESADPMRENIYQNRCVECRQIFMGWKRRLVCAVCARPQASAAVPDLSACFMTAESGGGDYKIVLRFQTLAKMQDAHSAMVHWLAASQPEVRNAN